MNGSGDEKTPTPDRVPDIRLIACDLDGTLLDDDDAIHQEFWPLVEELHARGVTFCPASGRQYYNLRERFAPIADEVVFIAENGTYVVHAGKEVSSNTLDRSAVTGLVATARALADASASGGAVLCGKLSAYVERADQAFLDVVGTYYQRLQVVADLSQVDDDILKLAVYDDRSSEVNVAPAFAGFQSSHQVVVSGQHWLDVMNRGVNKGAGLRQVQQALGVGREQTMVFGDFLNDLEMMDEALYSFAMANAHPVLAARARYVAPGNTENGVVRTIRRVLRMP